MQGLESFSRKLILAGGLSLLLGSSCFYVVYPGERAIILDNVFGGIRDEVYGEGVHFRIPITQEIIKYSIRLTPEEFQTFANTKDQQSVKMHLRLLHK
jgi:prohibitin 1